MLPDDTSDTDVWKQRLRLCAILLGCLVLATAAPHIAIATIRLLGLLGTGVSIRVAYWVAVISKLIPPAQILFGSLLYAFVGLPFAWRALSQMRSLHLNGDTLVGLGVTVLFAHGVHQVLFGQPPKLAFFDVGLVAGCVCLGRFLRFRTLDKLTDAVRRLHSLTPTEASVVDTGDEGHGDTTTRSVSELQIGDCILVRPGERIPLDATVLSGTAQADESWLTGAPREVVKTTGEPLLAGSLTVGGPVSAAVTAAAGETYLSRIIEFIRNAQCSQTNGQRRLDRTAYWIVPGVLLISLATLFVWGLMIGDWHYAIRSAAAVIIVSCPSALASATRTAMLAACQRSARQGILIKDAQTLQVASQLSCVILDAKPLTDQVQVIRAEPIGGEEDLPQNWLPMAAAAGHKLNQPLTSAILDYADTNVPLPQATECKSLLGEGIQAVVEGKQVLVGNERLLRRFRVAPSDNLSREKPNRQLSVMHVAIDGQHVGRITLRSTSDPDGKHAINQLRKLGLITMLGSHDLAFSSEAGKQTDQIDGQLTPANRHALVKKMRAAGHRVAVVENDVNDTQALVAADIGIVKGIPSKAALKTADVVLTRGDTRQVLTVVKIARATKSTIRWNLVWTVAHHLCLIPLAAGLCIPLTRFVPWGWLLFGQLSLSPTLAAAAMTFTDVSVVANSQRLAIQPES